MNYNIEVEKNPKNETINKIRKGLISHNAKNSTIAQSESIALNVHSNKGALIGGAVAWQWGECLEIEYLWISEDARGNKLGTELLNRLESPLTETVHKVVITNTFSFQALGFYKKNGYKVTDIVTGYPNDVKKYFLKKTVNV